MSTVNQLLGVAHPDVYSIRKLLTDPNTGSDPTLVYGVELEIEGITEGHGSVIGIRMDTDGSLRNNGREFITKPMRFRELAYCLNNLFVRNKFTEDNYSERCSVHVHANCTDLTKDQLSTVLLIYQVFERVLFNFAGGERDKNIFCVPWYETNLTQGIVNSLITQGPEALRRWQKYTAVNLLPLFTYGTIEFRHMPGTNNLEKILNWVNIIGCMFAYARVHPLEEVKAALTDLNTSSAYIPLAEQIFQEYFPMLVTSEEDFIALEEGVLSMKYSLLPNDDVPVSSPRPSARPVRSTASVVEELRRLQEEAALRASTPIAPTTWFASTEALLASTLHDSVVTRGVAHTSDEPSF